MTGHAKGNLFIGAMLFLLAMAFMAAKTHALNAGSVGIAIDMSMVAGALLGLALRCGADVFLITTEGPVADSDS